jgi:hypothetical protein
LACQRGGSVKPAPLDHPPKTWTAFPDADKPRRDRAQGYVLDLRSNVITLPPFGDKKI